MNQGISYVSIYTPDLSCKGPSIIVNIKLGVQNLLFKGGGQWKKFILYTFNIFDNFFLSFSWQIIHFKNVDMYTFLGVGGSEKVYGLYTHLNVDN